MNRMKLGQSQGAAGLDVSAWCLGTMTYGNQTPEADAHAQMDMALAHGVTFFDCAEMYPVAPVSAETVGNSERILGTWFAASGKRDQIQLATKVSGENGGFIRDGKGFNAKIIAEAIDASLERLQTDHIDLYQLHWPGRGSYHFRQYWNYRPGTDVAAVEAHMHEVLEALETAKTAGKIGAYGLSNETAWGTAKWLQLAGADGMRPVSIQNEYSLLCRLYDTDMAELSSYEQIPLLAYSPLATGLLTGKYAGGVVPEGSRAERTADLGGRMTHDAHQAVAAYLGYAREQGLDPVHMALAFVAQRPFPAIPIFGATTTVQLERTLKGTDLRLSDAQLADLDDLHRGHAMPF